MQLIREVYDEGGAYGPAGECVGRFVYDPGIDAYIVEANDGWKSSPISDYEAAVDAITAHLDEVKQSINLSVLQEPSIS